MPGIISADADVHLSNVSSSSCTPAHLHNNNTIRGHSTTAQPHAVAWFPHSASFQIFPPHHPTLRWRMISTAQTRVTHQLQLCYWIYPISHLSPPVAVSPWLVRGVTSPRSGVTDSSMTVGADTGGTAVRANPSTSTSSRLALENY